MTNLTDDGLDVGDGITLTYAPVNTAGAPITGASADITLTIKEPGVDAITKTGGELTEEDGVYSYVHKITREGITYGKFVYDGAGNLDDTHQFWFSVRGLKS